MSTRRKPLKAKRAVSLRPTRRPSRAETLAGGWDMGRPGRTPVRGALRPPRLAPRVKRVPACARARATSVPMLTRAGAAAQAKNYKARESEAGQL